MKHHHVISLYHIIIPHHDVICIILIVNIIIIIILIILILIIIILIIMIIMVIMWDFMRCSDTYCIVVKKSAYE